MSSKTPKASLVDEIQSLENYLELLSMQKGPSSTIIKLHEQEVAPAMHTCERDISLFFKIPRASAIQN